MLSHDSQSWLTKTKSPQPSAFFSPHVLITLIIFLTGVFIALFATAGSWETARQTDAQVPVPNHVLSASIGNVHKQWVARYNGPGNGGDFATAMAVDSLGNIYVTGGSTGEGTDLDYATIKYNSALQQQWIARYNGPGNSVDVAFAIAVDGIGNVYVTGNSVGSDIFGDYATIKYNSAGQQQWVARYDGPEHGVDDGAAIVVDVSGNVYVTGDSSGLANSDYATIKYNWAGQEQWVVRYDANFHDYGKAIAVDRLGNVYVTGTSWGEGHGYDYATVKYDRDGQQRWVARYNGGVGASQAAAIALDRSGNVYVTGVSNSDYATIKYSPAGQQEWATRYAAGGASAVAVDISGNVYVTGASASGGYATVKYNSAGEQQWVALYDGGFATGIALDDSSNVYVTGSSPGGPVYDYATVKYSADGQQEWIARYNGTGNANDQAGPIAVDDSGNVYVTGWSSGSGTGADYATIKYGRVGVRPRPTPRPRPTQ